MLLKTDPNLATNKMEKIKTTTIIKPVGKDQVAPLRPMVTVTWETDQVANQITSLNPNPNLTTIKTTIKANTRRWRSQVTTTEAEPIFNNQELNNHKDSNKVTNTITSNNRDQDSKMTTGKSSSRTEDLLNQEVKSNMLPNNTTKPHTEEGHTNKATQLGKAVTKHIMATTEYQQSAGTADEDASSLSQH